MRSLGFVGLLWVFICSLLACKKEKSNTIVPVSRVQTPKETLEIASSVDPILELPHGPNAFVLDFVEEIEDKGWISDSLRLQQVGIYKALDRKGVQLFAKKPFYPIAFKNSEIYDGFHHPIGRTSLEATDIAVFEKVLHIWAYYYRKAGTSSWIEDGVIEQWAFPDTATAAQAKKILQKPMTGLYFNTRPYYHQHQHYLYVFQARAMAFSYTQQPLFADFKKKTEQNTP
ncbi:MAG: hypothetical protein OIF50_13170 [Flavobacteriaceae bacterium]|nr:hypothetical protein [Flavobacteriaceae bacterium]